MFRLVTTEPDPALFFLCDHQHCAKSFFAKIPSGMEEPKAIFSLMQHLGKAGWQVRPYGQYCPDHHDKTELKQGSIIVPGTGIPVNDLVRDPRGGR